VLPETDEDAAWEAAHRISAKLAIDPEPPTLSASLGVAVYPRDGENATALLGSADRVLYAAKASGRSRRRVAVGTPAAAAAKLGPLFEVT